MYLNIIFIVNHYRFALTDSIRMTSELNILIVDVYEIVLRAHYTNSSQILGVLKYYYG